MATSLGEGKLWNQTFELGSKIDLVSHPDCTEGLGKYICTLHSLYYIDSFYFCPLLIVFHIKFFVVNIYD